MADVADDGRRESGRTSGGSDRVLDERMKYDGLGKNVVNEEARAILLEYLDATSVLMGDGTKATKTCTLCMERMVPALGAASSCVCQRAREFIRGHP